jgi:glycosyltransferase involved in cell wall biosynthesis
MADKITATLESLLAQTIAGDLEIIVVNDGSRDQVSSVFEAFLQKHPDHSQNLRFFNQDNLGAPAARNRGLAEAHGDFLFFCDADAVLVPSALERLLTELATHQEASYAYPSFIWGKKLFKIGAFDAEKLKAGPMIHTMALIRREAMTTKGWDESIKKLQDWDLWLTMLEEGRTGVWVDEVLFTIQPGGTISSWLPSFAYKLLPFLPSVKKYKTALAIVKAKHKLS